ncbi:hypothetical protein CH289_07950 [Rhodococcus sp. RS1C4]|nr:hypothetical protein [Rhodococcus sp. RS1C4]OZC54862.1 hypothetical protein CH289_07950 [Rhodococcus sp. RS1C4]
MTIIEAGTAEWQLSISASKAPKIYGVAGKWGGPRSVYEPMRAAYIGEPLPQEESSQIQKDGHHLEPAIRGMWLDRNPGATLLGHEVQFTRDDAGFPASATPDDFSDGRLVQMKSDRHGQKFGRPGTNEVPLVYYVQTMFELWVARHTDPSIERCIMPVLGTYLDLNTYVIDWNPQHAEAIVNVCRDFYINNVVAGVPPEADGSDADYDIIRRQHPEIEADSKWEIHPELAIRYIEARNAAAEAETAVTKLKSDILDRVGSAREIMCGKQKIGNRQPTKKGVALYPPRKEVDLDQLRAELANYDQENAA